MNLPCTYTADFVLNGERQMEATYSKVQNGYNKNGRHPLKLSPITALVLGGKDS